MAQYSRVFITLLQDRPGFGLRSRDPSGRAIIEVKDGMGKITVAMQELKSEIVYKAYIISSSNDGLAVSIGTLCANERGKVEHRWEFDPIDVEQTGIDIHMFDVVALAAETKAENVWVLTGYRDGEVRFKDKFNVAVKREKAIVQTQGEKESKTELHENDSKPELHEKESKTELRENDSKPELREKESKTELREKESKTELHENDSKPELREKESKKELREKESKAELRGKEIKTLRHEDHHFSPMNMFVEEEPASRPELKVVVESVEINLEQEAEAGKIPHAKTDRTKPGAMGSSPDNHTQFNSMAQRFNKELEELENLMLEGAAPEIDPQLELENVMKNNAVMSPFKTGFDEVKWVRISIKELSYLPCNCWKLMYDPYVNLAFSRYKHLMLGAYADKTRYILALPDAFDPSRERQARDLGFDIFRSSDNIIGHRDADYGYWLMDIGD